MEETKEGMIIGYPKILSYKCTQKIIEQMEKSICKISIGKVQGTGFFCKLPFSNKSNIFSVLITNNHILNDKILYKTDAKFNIYIEDENISKKIKEINLNNRLKYTNEEYDITIIEIKEDDGIKDYLELDDTITKNIFKDWDDNEKYIGETAYIIQYPEGELSVSYGIIQNIYEDKKYNFIHKCSTRFGSSGSPILNINNKIIGIHKEVCNKYNIGAFLNYPIKEFIKLYYDNIKEILFKKFNKKYELDYNNTKISELDLSLIGIGNEGLNLLSLIEFKELKKLNLYRNKILDIEELKNLKAEKLEILILNTNEIEEINIFKKVNYKMIKELYLESNFIIDIKVLENVEFAKLEILDLSHNKIQDIDILEKANFKELTKLNLQGNNISDIKVLEKVKFKKLEFLHLDNNEISNIEVLEKVDFKDLKELYLYSNDISDIKVLEKTNFEKLEKLFLNWNKISDIYVLEKVNFKELKLLFLSGNNISNINVLENSNFEKLEFLHLDNNQISDISALQKVNFRELKKLYLYSNNIADIKILENVKIEKLELLNLSENKISDISVLQKVNFKELAKLYLCSNSIVDIKILENLKIDKLELLELRGNDIDETINQLLISNLKLKIKEFII